MRVYIRESIHTYLRVHSYSPIRDFYSSQKGEDAGIRLSNIGAIKNQSHTIAYQKSISSSQDSTVIGNT